MAGPWRPAPVRGPVASRRRPHGRRRSRRRSPSACNCSAIALTGEPQGVDHALSGRTRIWSGGHVHAGRAHPFNGVGAHAGSGEAFRLRSGCRSAMAKGRGPALACLPASSCWRSPARPACRLRWLSGAGDGVSGRGVTLARRGRARCPFGDGRLVRSLFPAEHPPAAYLTTFWGRCACCCSPRCGRGQPASARSRDATSPTGRRHHAGQRRHPRRPLGQPCGATSERC